eukprot:Em0008g174a
MEQANATDVGGTFPACALHPLTVNIIVFITEKASITKDVAATDDCEAEDVAATDDCEAEDVAATDDCEAEDVAATDDCEAEDVAATDDCEAEDVAATDDCEAEDVAATDDCEAEDVAATDDCEAEDVAATDDCEAEDVAATDDCEAEDVAATDDCEAEDVAATDDCEDGATDESPVFAEHSDFTAAQNERGVICAHLQKQAPVVVFDVRDTLVHFLHRAHASVQVEVGAGLFPDHSQSRPADILLQNWNLGRPVALDISVVSPLNPSTLAEAGATFGAVLEATESRKHQANDEKCSALGWVSTPLASFYSKPTCYHKKTPSRPPMTVTAHRSINSQPGEQSLESTSDEEHENRTEYELARVRKIQRNREFLNQQEMLTTSNTMDDDDAVLVASQWWQSQRSARYLGHHISAEGISPAEDKKCAVLDAPVPQNIPQLRSFLGLVNYYGKFLHKLADTLAPLHQLLRKHEPWHWGQQQERAFAKAKSQLTSTCILTHFDPDKRLVLSCDASPYGLGAVLAHLFEDGSERPIAFASRSLAPAEKKYSQIEKETLAIIYGVKRFHQYLLGRSAREQSNADGLSRLPIEEAPKEVFLPGEMVLTLGALSDEDCPVTVTSIRAWTARDPILARVKALVLGGWPGNTNLCGELRTYQQRAMELSVQDGCVLWGSRVVPAGRAQLLHEGHPGITRMKALARGVEVSTQGSIAPMGNGLLSHGHASTLIMLAPFWQTIRELRHLFATHGLPEIVVSDNGTAFSSTEFGCFMKHNGIRHIRCAPYHPSSNRLAERAVQTFKEE